MEGVVRPCRAQGGSTAGGVGTKRGARQRSDVMDKGGRFLTIRAITMETQSIKGTL